MQQARHIPLAAAVLATAALLLVGCTTPYQPLGATGGFSDKQISPGRHSVEYVGNGYTPPAVVTNMYLYRCAEITVQNGFDVFRSMAPDVARPGWTPMAQAVQDAAEPVEFKSAGTTRYVPVYTPSSGSVSSRKISGVVQMGRYADVPSNVRVWDARLVVRSLERIVKSNDKDVKGLATEDLAKVAMVPGRGRAVNAGGTTLDDLQHLLRQSGGAQ